MIYEIGIRKFVVENFFVAGICPFICHPLRRTLVPLFLKAACLPDPVNEQLNTSNSSPSIRPYATAKR
ncbi:MAG TPA: hypothetical protein VF540_06005 [Segetibacter sp.]|jgi:hypothetical protein